MAAGAVVVCVKWVDLRPEVDSLTGAVTAGSNSHGFSPADLAALAVGLEVADRCDLAVWVACVGPSGADAALRDLAANRIARLVRVDADPSLGSPVVASELASFIERNAPGSLVLCGEHSLDRGSGSVPAFLAHRLGAAQLLGVAEMGAWGDGTRLESIEGWRRLGGGRRELVRVGLPAVVSVESGVARVPRAALSAVLRSRDRSVEVVPARHEPVPAPAGSIAAFRPPTGWLPAPAGASALDRILELTGALVDRTPPRVLRLGPADAADAILDSVRAWTSHD